MVHIGMEGSANLPEGRLLKVHPPEGAQDDTSVDIIAIHGLGTTTPYTWEYKTKTGVVNWLSDSNMLPDVVPCARIYTYSWNARYYSDASVARIADVAEVLLSNLQSQRDKEDTHSRPITFVASCFGGLVVTKAFEIANMHNSQYRKLLVATSGVVFLASPLQGTRAGKAAQWQAMLCGILDEAASQTLVEDLDGSTRALRNTSENFVKMVTTAPMKTMTMCFWESKKTQVLKAKLPAWALLPLSSLKVILVEEDSACFFGRPKLILDASHSMMNKFSGPDDANFGLVGNAIKRMVEEADGIAVDQREAHQLHNKHFMVYRRPNPLFTGREEELGKLDEALCPSRSTRGHTAIPKTYVLYGMGGAGKSEVAVRFAHDSRLRYWGVFWIDGRSKTSISNGFATIARMCGHRNESPEDTILWLQNLSHSWLLILDNADNKDLDLMPFLPAGRNGSILITTRLTECAKYQTVGKDHYERLSRGTAIDLLLKACGIALSSRGDHEVEARAVTELLGCHALAIIQAGAAISQNWCDLGEYKDIFHYQRRALLQCFPEQAKSDYEGIYATFEVTAAYLEESSDPTAKDALQLLNFYAFMHFSDFPEIAFEEAWKNSKDKDVVSSRLLADGGEDIQYLSSWHVSHLPTFLQSNSHDIDLDKIRLRKVRSLLESLSLVTFDSAQGTTRMHPVSHFWSKDRLRDPEKCTNARLNGLSVLSLSIRDPYTVDVLPLSSQLQPHIETIAHSLEGWSFATYNFHLQQSVYWLSYVMYRLDCHSALFEFLQTIPIQNDECWARTENGQRIQLLHSKYLRKYGDVHEAVALLEKLNAMRVQTFAAEDPEVLDLQHGLAKAYLAIGDTTKAVAFLERVVQIGSVRLHPDDPNLLGSKHELARVYLWIDETAKAIGLLEEVMRIQTKTLRPEHRHRLISQHELARAYLRVDQTPKAIDLLEEVVRIQTKTLRPEHRHRLTSQHTLARAYLYIDETAKAMGLLEEVVTIESGTLRPDHRDRLRSQYQLAQAYLRVEETDKAIALLEHVVEIEAKTLRADHADRVDSIYLLARCHYHARNYERALELARSIENVAQNRRGEEIADWNAVLIGSILEKIELANAT